MGEGANEDDSLTLAPRNFGPIVGVGRVREVFVLAELLAYRLGQIAELNPSLATGQQSLNGQLLSPPHDVFNHGP